MQGIDNLFGEHAVQMGLESGQLSLDRGAHDMTSQHNYCCDEHARE